MNADDDRPPPPDTTVELLQRVRSGEPGSRDELVRRYLPILQRWARGRLPRYARDLAETGDLVQLTLLRALDRVETFENRGEGSFLAYLRRILVNAIADEIRRAGRRPARESLPESAPSPDASPLERAIGADMIETYEAALATLSEREHQAVVLRIELGYSWPEVASAIGVDKANTARMIASRALTKVVEAMDVG